MGKNKRAVQLEDKWDNVHGEMKKVVLGRKEEEEGEEWKKVTSRVDDDVEVDEDKWMKLVDLEVKSTSTSKNSVPNLNANVPEFSKTNDKEEKQMALDRSGEQWQNVLDMI